MGDRAERPIVHMKKTTPNNTPGDGFYSRDETFCSHGKETTPVALRLRRVEKDVEEELTVEAATAGRASRSRLEIHISGFLVRGRFGESEI